LLFASGWRIFSNFHYEKKIGIIATRSVAAAMKLADKKNSEKREERNERQSRAVSQRTAGK